LMPLTEAYPPFAGAGRAGVGGKVSHCGSARATVVSAISKKPKTKAERRMAHLTPASGKPRRE
jgi:hypothetical protein